MYFVYCDNKPLYDLRDESLVLEAPTVTLTQNSAGTFQFVIMPKHPHYDDIHELDFTVDIHSGRDLLVLNVALDIFGQPAAELGNVFLLDGQADGIGMAAESLQEVSTRLDSCIDIKAAHRARRASSYTIGIIGQHYRGAEIQLSKPCCHNADDTLVPVAVIDDDGLLAVKHLGVTVNNLVGLDSHLAVKLLAVTVILVDSLGNLHCALHIAAHQQLNRFLS